MKRKIIIMTMVIASLMLTLFPNVTNVKAAAKSKITNIKMTTSKSAKVKMKKGDTKSYKLSVKVKGKVHGINSILITNNQSELKAIGLTKKKIAKAYTVKSNKPKLAKVTKKGNVVKVKALKKGSAIIKIKFKGKKIGTIKVTVKGAEKSKPTTNTTPAINPDNQNENYAKKVVELVNEERAKVGLNALAQDKTVEAAALVRAKELETYFSHTRPDGTLCYSILDEYNIDYWSAGENIAMGQTTPKAVMQSWMNSEGHRANILNTDFTKIGVGYYKNSSGMSHWVQIFIR